eukprot:CAMPEP_0178776334 /NCGR_PEP_ID=MMETSP0744-20121128/24665_1 /TAXON_ID=913974 /ORGANISM="Nitzschia punctata, Strain CCMP561" /LENGTH=141 /DNA_ID=CAMNT_0020433361 /DNA_START=312 /DNA_END=739 /DNA_ORIENTATION=+
MLKHWEVTSIFAKSIVPCKLKLIATEIWEHGITPEDTEIQEVVDDEEITPPGDLVVEENADGDDKLEPPPFTEEDEVEKKDGEAEEAEEEKEEEKQGEGGRKVVKYHLSSCPDEDEEVLIQCTKTERKIASKRWSSVEGYY